jgi:hypothetical protein
MAKQILQILLNHEGIGFADKADILLEVHEFLPREVVNEFLSSLLGQMTSLGDKAYRDLALVAIGRHVTSEVQRDVALEVCSKPISEPVVGSLHQQRLRYPGVAL